MARELLDHKLVFVTGKGGVGKTTTAAALAFLAAQRGKRTLVCEVDEKGDLAAALEVAPTTFREREVHPNLWAMTMDTEDSLREYLTLQLRLPLLARIGPLARIFDYVATAAPGVREVLTIGKLLWEVRDKPWDLVVVDAVATGHIVGHLNAPQAINDLVQVGLIRHQTDWMVEMLRDEATTALCIVATPEEMPVSETVELAARVRAETDVHLAAVVVNRVLPELFSSSEEAVFERFEEPATQQRLGEAAGGEVSSIVAGARLAVVLRRTRARHLDHLRASIDPSVPMLYVPELFVRTQGLRSVRQVAEALSAEMGY